MSHATVPIRRRLWLGLSRNFVTSVFVQGSTFGLNLLAARVLPAAGFGELLMMLTTLTTAGGIGQLASGYTATKYLAEFRLRDRVRASRILALCTLVAVAGGVGAALALALGARWIATSWLHAPGLERSLLLVAVAVFFVVLNGQRTGVLNGLEEYQRLARIGVVSGVTYAAFGAGGLLLAGVDGGLVGIAASAGLQWLLLEHGTRTSLAAHRLSQPFAEAWREQDSVAHFALPAALSGLVAMSSVWLVAGMVVRVEGGQEQLALFGAANALRVVVLFVPQVVSGVATTLLNSQLGNAPGYRRVFWGTLALAAGTAALIAAGFAMLAPHVLQIFGAGFERGAGALRLLMVAAVAEALVNNLYQVVQSYAQMWRSLGYVVLPRDLTLVGLGWALTPGHGAVGLAAAYAGAWMLALAIVSVWTYRLGLGAGRLVVDDAPAALQA